MLFFLSNLIFSFSNPRQSELVIVLNAALLAYRFSNINLEMLTLAMTGKNPMLALDVSV